MKNDNQMNPTASSEITQVNSFLNLISQDFMNEIRQIGITGMQRTIKQAPAQDNGHTAICSVQVDTSQGEFSDFGVATPDSIGGSIDAGELLEKASTQGTRKALGMVLFAHNTQPVLDITPPPSKQLPSNKPLTQHQSHTSKNGNGGGGKPASDKQIS